MHTITLIEKTTIADNVLSLKFSKPEGFSFEAGQFVQFLIPDGEEIAKRSYSIASIPTDSELEFCVKLLEGGKAATFFAAMNPGDSVEISKPMGRFIVAEGAPAYYFVATGAGMAPIMAQIRDLVEAKQTEADIHVLFGVRSQKDLFWKERLAELADKARNFSYEVTLSQPEDGWKGLSGRVTAHIQVHNVDHHFYLCGSSPMVMDVRKMLLDNHIQASQMHFEIF